MVQRRSIVFAACLTVTAVAGLALGWLLPAGEPPAPQASPTTSQTSPPRASFTRPAHEASQDPPAPSNTGTNAPPPTASPAALADHSMGLLEDHLEASLQIAAELDLEPAEHMQVERLLEAEFDHLTVIAQDADLGGLEQSTATAEWDRVRAQTDATLQKMNLSSDLTDFREELSPPWETQP